MNRLPSVKTLMSVLSVDKDVAKKVRLALEGPGALPKDHEKYAKHYNPPSLLDRKLDAIDELIEGFGTEAIRGPWVGGYWGDTVAVFIEMGDVYNGTILFDVERETFYATTVGDWVETAENTGRIKFQ